MPLAALGAGMLPCRQRGGGHGCPPQPSVGPAHGQGKPSADGGSRDARQTPPERWLAAVWPWHPLMLRSRESKRGVLGWLQAFRHGRDAEGAECRSDGYACKILAGARPRASRLGCGAEGSCDWVPGRGAEVRGARRALRAGVQPGGLRSPGSRIGAAPSSACPSDPWSHSCWVTGDGAQQGL